MAPRFILGVDDDDVVGSSFAKTVVDVGIYRAPVVAQDQGSPDAPFCGLEEDKVEAAHDLLVPCVWARLEGTGAWKVDSPDAHGVEALPR